MIDKSCGKPEHLSGRIESVTCADRQDYQTNADAITRHTNGSFYAANMINCASEFCYHSRLNHEWLYQMIDPQILTARSMVKLVTSKRFTSFCFAFLSASALFQAFINSDDPTSTFVAVLPALAVISMAWLTAIRLVLPKPDNA